MLPTWFRSGRDEVEEELESFLWRAIAVHGEAAISCLVSFSS